MKPSIRIQIRQELEDNSEQQYSAFSSALLPNLSRSMLGVRLPVLRSMAKRLAKADWEKTVAEGLTSETFEEVMLRGFILGYASMPWERRWHEICKFVPLIDNWSLCDSCCATYTAVREHRGESWPDLISFLESSREFHQRFAIVMMMDHYLVDDYIDEILEVWSDVKPHGYYVEMAIGWALSVAFLKYPDKTLPLLHGERLSLACRRRACQKILESRRTPLEVRPYIIKLKRSLLIR